MRKLFINFIFSLSILQGLNASIISNNDSVLQKIISKYASLNSFKCNFDFFTNTSNYLQNYTMIIGRNQSDSLYGYNFHIYADKSKGENEEFIYNSAYFISQINNKIEHLDKNKNLKFRDSIKLLLGRYTEILNYSPLELSKILKNKYNLIVKQQDNSINSMSCYHYIIKQKDGTTIDLFFDKQTLNPILMEKVSKNRKTIFFYRNTEANPFSQINYFMNKVSFYNRTLHKNSVIGKDENVLGRVINNWAYPILNNKDSLFSGNLKGKIVLIEFTAIFCSPCRSAINEIMNSIEEKYKNRNDITVISVFGFKDDKEADIIEYCRKNNVQTKYVLYNAGELEKKFKISGYPSFFILDKDGRIIYQEIGNYNDSFKILDMEFNNVNK